jgi:hypothetical protein
MGCAGSKGQGEDAGAKPKNDPKPDDKKASENGKEDHTKENGHKASEAKKGGDDKPGDGSDDEKNKEAEKEKVNPISPGDVETFYKFGKEIGKYVLSASPPFSMFLVCLLLCSSSPLLVSLPCLATALGDPHLMLSFC